MKFLNIFTFFAFIAAGKICIIFWKEISKSSSIFAAYAELCETPIKSLCSDGVETCGIHPVCQNIFQLTVVKPDNGGCCCQPILWIGQGSEVVSLLVRNLNELRTLNKTSLSGCKNWIKMLKLYFSRFFWFWCHFYSEKKSHKDASVLLAFAWRLLSWRRNKTAV